MELSNLLTMDPIKITEEQFEAYIEHCRLARPSWVQDDKVKAANKDQKKIASVAALELFAGEKT